MFPGPPPELPRRHRPWTGSERSRPFCRSLALKKAIAAWLREGGVMPGGKEDGLMSSQSGLVNAGAYLHAWVTWEIMTRASVAWLL